MKYINDNTKIVLYSACDNCHQRYPVVLDHYEQIKNAFVPSLSLPNKLNCNKCKVKNGAKTIVKLDTDFEPTDFSQLRRSVANHRS